MCTVIRRDRFHDFHFTAKEVTPQDFVPVVECAFLMSTNDIVAKQARQFQKDRDEQARSESSRVMQLDFRIVLSKEASVMRVVNFLAAHHSSYGSKRLRAALQFFTILHTLSGRRG